MLAYGLIGISKGPPLCHQVVSIALAVTMKGTRRIGSSGPNSEYSFPSFPRGVPNPGHDSSPVIADEPRVASASPVRKTTSSSGVRGAPYVKNAYQQRKNRNSAIPYRGGRRGFPPVGAVSESDEVAISLFDMSNGNEIKIGEQTKNPGQYYDRGYSLTPAINQCRGSHEGSPYVRS